MLRLFAGHPTAANLLMLALLAIGLLSLPELRRETLPEIKFHEVKVAVAYPGAGPVEVEQGICLPLEQVTNGISFLKEKRCEARSNMGSMTLKMLEQGDFDTFLDDVRAAVGEIDNFPATAKAPVITELGRTSPVVSLALTVEDENFSASELKDLAEVIKAKMQATPGIPLVELGGFSQRQLIVSVKPEKLRQYQISLQQIAALLQKQNLDLPLGDLTNKDKTYELRFIDERQTPEALGQLTLLSASNGAQIHLNELADIYFGFDKEEEYATFDGQRVALLKVLKSTQDDSLDVHQVVKEFADTLALPKGINLTLTQDSTGIVKDRLNMLVSNAWQGLVLVFLTLLMFFGLRYSFWVITGLPVSFIAGLFVMAQLDLTINMMSMVALLLALGILMDDAIVISESVAEHARKGLAPLDAVTQGLGKVSQGVISSFLTTAFVFGSILGLQGDLGQILKVVPLILLIVISVSLVEAFFILPSHLHHTLKHQDANEPGRLQQRVNIWFEAKRKRLGDVLEKAIQYRYAVIGTTAAAFFLSIAMMSSGILKFNALPEIDGDILEARLIMPGGTPLAETEHQVQEILNALMAAEMALQGQEDSPLIEHITVRYGENPDAFDTGPHLATISLDLLTAEQRNTSIDTLISAWLHALPPMPRASKVMLAEPSIGPAGRAIEMRLTGLDRPQLAAASQQLQVWLARYHGVYNVLDDYRPGKPQLNLNLKPEARILNLDASTVANQLRSAFAGLVIDEVYREINSTLPGFASTADNMEIVVQLDQSQPDLDTLRDFPIVVTDQTGQPRLIPLATLADIHWQRDISRIQRINNQGTITVFGSLNALEANTVEVVNDTLSRFVPQLKRDFPGLQIDVQGEMKNSSETQGSLRSGLILGLLGIFALLSFQFRSYAEPLLVMVAIPLALIGVVLGHLIMGQNLAMPSMIGFVSLAGIVVNNSILLVEFIKHNCRDGMSLEDAARQASQDRLRAIVLTTSTTVAGMLPLLFETSLQAQVLIPLVISVSFGLLVSTALVLIVLPCLYLILQDFKEFRAERILARA
ncbi:efflux RND transporter permease subunit [Parendozoicomonas haliclonae]|uniref:Multidrug resistance protein MdtB n=1 Tax=Parendozoicomonas haliclonae TaxID=1960125 RepID=A0A1X7ALN9_9GAMM|nr:efflux RND transporter permease subunit [Parendozoicomonas haliclonae]SMA48883.1 Multidrug resistance protein MdtB [Parendozoicomonas haliclonae]